MSEDPAQPLVSASPDQSHPVPNWDDILQGFDAEERAGIMQEVLALGGAPQDEILRLLKVIAILTKITHDVPGDLAKTLETAHLSSFPDNVSRFYTAANTTALTEFGDHIKALEEQTAKIADESNDLGRALAGALAQINAHTKRQERLRNPLSPLAFFLAIISLVFGLAAGIYFSRSIESPTQLADPNALQLDEAGLTLEVNQNGEDTIVSILGRAPIDGQQSALGGRFRFGPKPEPITPLPPSEDLEAQSPGEEP